MYLYVRTSGVSKELTLTQDHRVYRAVYNQQNYHVFRYNLAEFYERINDKFIAFPWNNAILDNELRQINDFKDRSIC